MSWASIVSRTLSIPLHFHNSWHFCSRLLHTWRHLDRTLNRLENGTDRVMCLSSPLLSVPVWVWHTADVLVWSLWVKKATRCLFHRPLKLPPSRRSGNAREAIWDGVKHTRTQSNYFTLCAPHKKGSDMIRLVLKNEVGIILYWATGLLLDHPPWNSLNKFGLEDMGKEGESWIMPGRFYRPHICESRDSPTDPSEMKHNIWIGFALKHIWHIPIMHTLFQESDHCCRLTILKINPCCNIFTYNQAPLHCSK